MSESIIQMQRKLADVTAKLEKAEKEVQIERALREDAQNHHTASMIELGRILGMEDPEKEPRFKWVALQAASIKEQLEKAEKELAEAQATFARLAKQEPVAWLIPQSTLVTFDEDWARKNTDYCDPLFLAPVAAPAESNVYVAPIPAPESNPVQWLEDEGDNILVPRGLLGAACSAIDKQRQAPKVLEAMRHYTMNAPQAPAVPEEWRDKLLAEFPLLDDEGLCQEKHHCEWTLQQDRKRLHALLQSANHSGGVTEKGV